VKGKWRLDRIPEEVSMNRPVHHIFLFVLLSLLFTFLLDLSSFTALSQNREAVHPRVDSSTCLQMFDKLRRAVQTKDLSTVYKALSPELRRRSMEFYGDEPSLLFASWDSLQLKGFSFVDTGARLDLAWYSAATKLEWPWYLVEDGNAVFLTLPVFAQTRAWQRKETNHFVFVFRGDSSASKYGISTPSSYAVDLLDKHYSTLANMLDMDLGGKAEIILAGSPEEAGSILGDNQRYQAVSTPPLGIIVSTFPWSVFHELAHLFEYGFTKRGVYQFSAPVIHGLAVYMDGNGGTWKGKPCIEWMKEAIGKGEFKSLEDLDSEPEFSYAATLVKFLVQEYGNKIFREFLSRSLDKEAFRLACTQLCGKTLKEFENEWKLWIMKNRLPSERKSTERDIIAHEWVTVRTKIITIVCDTKQSVPTPASIQQVETVLSKVPGRAGSEEPHTFYLVNDTNRMWEMFSVRDSVYKNGDVTAATRFDPALFEK
jgi:hypothetical protein